MIKIISRTSALPKCTGTITPMTINTRMKREKGQNRPNFIKKDWAKEQWPLSNSSAKGGSGGGVMIGGPKNMQKQKQMVLTLIP